MGYLLSEQAGNIIVNTNAQIKKNIAPPSYAPVPSVTIIPSVTNNRITNKHIANADFIFII